MEARETDLLKVKMGKLHETDIMQLKSLYEMKLRISVESMNRLDHENSQLREAVQLTNN